MLTGQKGIGKSTLINHFLFSIFDQENYDHRKYNLVKNSDFYIQFNNNIFQNIIYLNGIDYSSIKVDDIRDLKSKIFKSSIMSKNRFIILMPGSSVHLKHKRWPSKNFGELAVRLERKGYDIAVIGTDAERQEIETIKKYSSNILDYSNKDLSFLAALCRKSAGVVANDTGPTFIAGAVDCPITWLLSHHTNPDLVKPQCKNLKIIKKE